MCKSMPLTRTTPKAVQMLAEIAAWWIGHMRSLLPGEAARASRKPDALIVAIDRFGNNGTGHGMKPAGSVLLRRNGVETRLQPLGLDRPLPVGQLQRLPTALRLPHGTVICREVQLPMEAARDLPAVISFEMDRLTPFTIDELYWGISSVTPERAQGRIKLRLSIVLRAPVEALLHALATTGLTPSFIEAEAGHINLTAPYQRRRPGLRTILLVICGVLFVACLAAPFIRQQLVLNAGARAIASYQASTNTAQALRQQLITAAAGRAAVAQARHAGDALQVLATLTSALPDGTWLNDLTLKSGDLTFDGQSANAAKLIGRLSAVPGLHDPSFTAPVTRTADGKADQFSMHVSVGP